VRAILDVLRLLIDWLKAARHLIRTARRVLLDLLRLVGVMCRSRTAVEAENLFLRKQLALFQERKTKARRADDSTRWLMSFLSRWFDSRNALVLVKPETLIRWHRKGFRLFWRWKSRPTGRPHLPKYLQALILQIARENPTWGQEHIANELKLKLGIRVSPRTVGKYLAQCPRRNPDPSQRWLTFVRNHAQGMVACDFFVVVTARFCILHVFVLMELGRRRILYVNVTDHPSAEWTSQQLREALPGDHSFRLLIHDRDSIFSLELDKAVCRHGRPHIADASPITPSQCPMRTCGRNHPAGVPGFFHPVGPAASQASSQPLGTALQPWPRSYEPGTGHTGPACAIPA
jgi:putative transposase